MERMCFLIFSGGLLGKWALQEIREGDFLIGADRGAIFLLNHGFIPDFSLGDFDSVTPLELKVIERQSRSFHSFDAVDKDYSDTELALNWALERNPAEIVLLGATGTRFDHTLANVHLLVACLDRQVPCRIVDEHNEIIVTRDRVTISKSRFANVSLLPLSPKVTGITLQGFRYPLDQATLSMGQSLGVSNILTGSSGTIEISSGLLLVIQSID